MAHRRATSVENIACGAEAYMAADLSPVIFAPRLGGEWIAMPTKAGWRDEPFICRTSVVNKLTRARRYSGQARGFLMKGEIYAVANLLLIE